MMKPHPANARRHQAKRIAMRAALAGQRLDPGQVRIVVAAHDALFNKSNALMHEGDKVVASAPLESTTDHGYTVALRRLDQLDKQSEPLDTRAHQLRRHPQVRAVILAREKAEERRS
jgi:lysyl-tRNA synthetase class II